LYIIEGFLGCIFILAYLIFNFAIRRWRVSEIFGIDLGMGAIKLYNEKGNVEFLSQVSACTKRNIVGMGGLRTMNSCVLIELPSGKNYFSGPGAHSKATIIENFSLNRFSGSIDMRVLTYGVFSKFIDKFEAMDIPIILVVGLPIETLIGGEFKRTVNDLKSWLIGNHSWKANGKDYHILVRNLHNFTTSRCFFRLRPRLVWKNHS